MPAEHIKSIEVYKYRSDSIKAQPELIIFISEPKDITTVVGWIQGVKDEKVDSPSHIQSLYVILISYQNQASIVRKSIAYAVDDKGNAYAKAFSMIPEVYMDQFDESQISSLLEKMGKMWTRVTPLPLLAP